MSMMDAWQLMGIDDLRLNHVPRPVLAENEVLVQVKACGICSSDIPRIFENGTYHFPTIPGHEFAGLVVEGNGEAAEPWVGKRVAVFPLIPCGECAPCMRGAYEMCEHYDYLGSRSDGGFAEYVKVPVWNLVELPDAVSYEEAALSEPAAVARHAVAAVEKRTDKKVRSRVAVSGTGAIGLLIAQWQMAVGASEVVVLGRSEVKREMAEKAGLKYACVTSSEDEEALGKFDVVYEAVGSQESLDRCVRLAASSGCIVLVGNPRGDMTLEKSLYWKILRQQLCVLGVWNSSYESQTTCDWSDVMDAMASGALDVSRLVTHKFPFGELDNALSLMRDHREPYMKVLLFAE